MKVGYIAPTSIAAVNGGVRTQALNTIEHVKQLDVETVLLSSWSKIEEEKLDLIHIFAATIENVGISDSLKSLGIPSVLSPVFYSNHKASFIKTALAFEKVGRLFGSGIRSDFSIKNQLCHQADLLLPNTTEEAKIIEDSFGIPPAKIHVIPNGVEERFSSADKHLFVDKFGIQDFVLFVGQAGAPRKNIIKLLEAAPQFDVPVVIIGTLYDDSYGDKCRVLAENAGNVHFIDSLEHNSDLLASAYAACQVFALPSFYETPGIAALEAGLAGAKIVITKNGGTKEYFQNYAEFVDPDSQQSVLEGIQSALKKEKSDKLKQHILKNFTWQKVARKTTELYKSLLS
ncbi:MAG: glycosyltransferase family 4 protein [Balneolaceae bacterium]